jgi:hypothetical protein
MIDRRRTDFPVPEPPTTPRISENLAAADGQVEVVVDDLLPERVP